VRYNVEGASRLLIPSASSVVLGDEERADRRAQRISRGLANPDLAKVGPLLSSSWRNSCACFGRISGRPCSLEAEFQPRECDWARILAGHNLVSPDLKSFVGLSFRRLPKGFRAAEPPSPSFSATIKMMQAGFPLVMDTEVVFVK
jgi:hypothetical protein